MKVHSYVRARTAPIAVMAALAGLLTACGGGGGGGDSTPSSGTGSSPPPATLSINYTAPTYFMRGAAITTLTPTTSGSPTKFSISPALPAGLTLDPGGGALSGTSTGVSAAGNYRVTATLSLAVQTGNTYQVSVAARPARGSGAPLSYTWRSTDGVVQDVNASQTTWIAPSGPGLHFVYVVVSDEAGGYAKGRIVLNTDADGAPPFNAPATAYQAPPF